MGNLRFSEVKNKRWRHEDERIEEIERDTANLAFDIEGRGINVKMFGVKGNGNYYNGTDGKYYEDSAYTILSDDDVKINDILTKIDIGLINSTTLLFPDGFYGFNAQSLKKISKRVTFRAENPDFDSYDSVQLRLADNIDLISSADVTGSDWYGMTFTNIYVKCNLNSTVINWFYSANTMSYSLYRMTFNFCCFYGNTVKASTKAMFRGNSIMQSNFYYCDFAKSNSFAWDVCGDVNKFYHCRFHYLRKMLNHRRISTFGSLNSFIDCDFEVRRSATENNYMIIDAGRHNNYDNCYFEVADSLETPTVPCTTAGHTTYNKIAGWFDFSNAKKCTISGGKMDSRANFFTDNIIKFNAATSEILITGFGENTGEDNGTVKIDVDTTTSKDNSYVCKFQNCGRQFMRYVNQYNPLFKIDTVEPWGNSKVLNLTANPTESNFLKKRGRLINADSLLHGGEYNITADSTKKFAAVSGTKYPYSFELLVSASTPTHYSTFSPVFEVLDTQYYVVELQVNATTGDVIKVYSAAYDSGGTWRATLINNKTVTIATDGVQTIRFLGKLADAAFPNCKAIECTVTNTNDARSGTGTWHINYVTIDRQPSVIVASEYQNFTDSNVINPNSIVKLSNTATYDPPSLANGTQATTTVTVTNAKLGDAVRCGFSQDLQGVELRGYVSAANTVTCVFRNDTGGTIDLASGTLKVVVDYL